MMMRNEGYVKFQCRWIKSPALEKSALENINQWRTKLFAAGLIGAYPDGIGYGNVSFRLPKSKTFIISGTQTGTIPVLNETHYTEVLEVDMKKNRLVCKGPVEASSESMTHSAVYQASGKIHGVIHIHHREYWKKLLNRVPTTNRDVLYGTPEMAEEVLRLFRETDVLQKRIFVMGGHEEGIVAFGENLDEAGKVIESLSPKKFGPLPCA